MSRRLALAATTAIIVLGVATPSWAIFGRRKPAEQPPATAPAQPAPTQAGGAQPGAAPAPQKANAEERAMAERLDPLARAAFWAREYDIDPRDATAGVKAAASLRAIGQPDRAVETVTKVLLIYPDNVEALLEMGRAHIQRGQPFYGIEHLKKAELLAPRDWRALSLLGVAYDQTQRTAEARAIWQRALALSPDNPAILSNLALSLAQAGDTVQAEALLRRAVTQPGATLQTRQNLALVLGLQGKTAEAEGWLRQDLPPEVATANLQWLRQASSRTGATATPPRPGAAAATPARTWESMNNGG